MKNELIKEGAVKQWECENCLTSNSNEEANVCAICGAPRWGKG